MKLEKLLKIKEETEKFSLKLNKAIQVAVNISGYTNYEGKIESKQDISNTRTLDELKYAASDFKLLLTINL